MRAKWDPPRSIQRRILASELLRAGYTAAEAGLLSYGAREILADGVGLKAPDHELWRDVCASLAGIEARAAA